MVHTPGQRDVLLVNFYNHVPNAEQIATDAEVRWAGENVIETAVGELRRRGASGTRIGGAPLHRRLTGSRGTQPAPRVRLPHAQDQLLPG